MSDFNTENDYYEEEVERQTRAGRRRGLPLWPLVVILLLILAVFIALWSRAPSPLPTPVITPTATPALPTFPPSPTSTATPRPTPTPTLPAEVTVGGYVKVVGAGDDQLSYRSGPGVNYARLKLVEDGTILKVLGGPEKDPGGGIWWRLEDPAEEDAELKIGWAAEEFLEPTLP